MPGPPTAPLRPSLIRPILIAGAERRIVVLEATAVAVLLLGVGIHTVTIGVALVIALGIHPLLARIGRRDPLALSVYARSVRYQPFYPRAAHPDAPSLPNPPFDLGL